MASVGVVLKIGWDIFDAVDKVASVVALIQSFPGAVERPEFREMNCSLGMIRLIGFGDIPEHSIKKMPHRIDDGLNVLPNVSRFETIGPRNYETSIEVPLVRQRSCGFTLYETADAVRRSSIDVSARSIDTRGSEVRVRTIV